MMGESRDEPFVCVKLPTSRVHFFGIGSFGTAVESCLFHPFVKRPVLRPTSDFQIRQYFVDASFYAADVISRGFCGEGFLCEGFSPSSATVKARSLALSDHNMLLFNTRPYVSVESDLLGRARVGRSTSPFRCARLWHSTRQKYCET